MPPSTPNRHPAAVRSAPSYTVSPELHAHLKAFRQAMKDRNLPAAKQLLERARGARGISCLDQSGSQGEYSGLRGASRVAWIGMRVRDESGIVATGLISVDRVNARGLVSTLRDLEASVQRASARIRSASERAELARGLAERVSRELRTPMGALAHAIDRLRGEAERAGMSTEWVDRVACESERVARVVAYLEGELLVDSSGTASSEPVSSSI